MINEKFIDCTADFRELFETKYTPKEKDLIAKSLKNKDAQDCSKRCEKSKFCSAHLIYVKKGKYGCRQYYKDNKGLAKEVPDCNKGKKYIKLAISGIAYIETKEYN